MEKKPIKIGFKLKKKKNQNFGYLPHFDSIKSWKWYEQYKISCHNA